MISTHPILNDYDSKLEKFKGDEVKCDQFVLNTMDLVIDSIVKDKNTNSNRGLFKYFKYQGFLPSKDRLEEYNQRVYGIRKPSDTKLKKFVCDDCNIPKILNSESSHYVCELCGNSEVALYDPNPYESIGGYNSTVAPRKYKKVDHLNRFLRKCKQKLDYPIICFIRDEFKRIVPHIETVCDRYSKRSNLINYPYIIRKILRNSGKDEYLKFFPKMKSSKRIRGYDKIWREVCDLTGMKFNDLR